MKLYVSLPRPGFRDKLIVYIGLLSDYVMINFGSIIQGQRVITRDFVGGEAA